MKIGIYGGMFNPPHIGHISALKSYAEKMGLDKVIVVPCGKPSHKTVDAHINDEDRIALCRLAFSGLADIDDYEIKSAGLSYTVNTLKHFKELYPEDELFILIGDDMLMSFDTWHLPDEICTLCSVCYISRGANSEALFDKAKVLEKQYGGIFYDINCKPVVVSSTEIRNNINSGNVKELLSKEVYEYIINHKLYNE